MTSFFMKKLSLLLLMLAVALVPIRAARFAASFGNPGRIKSGYFAYPPIQPRQIDYKVIDNSTSPGNSRFKNEIGEDNAHYGVMLGSGYVFSLLDIHVSEGKGYTEVTLIVESFREAGIEVYPLEVASTIDNYIRVNSDYIQSFEGDALREFEGIMYHESTHVWQWTGNGQAPQSLLNGIADYVRLKAGFPSVNWGERGSGDSWDQGYEVTAYFLEYCGGLKGGFVAQLNAMMKDSYSDNFFDSLLGKSVDQLWSDYKLAYGNSPIASPAMPPVPGN
ncbi:hypothetical protein CRG98_040822 [Punica granatum]|nr:hypothetical protein CRG98_040822 [Punica granatum]